MLDHLERRRAQVKEMAARREEDEATAVADAERAEAAQARRDAPRRVSGSVRVPVLRTSVRARGVNVGGVDVVNALDRLYAALNRRAGAWPAARRAELVTRLDDLEETLAAENGDISDG